jgi:hypothetical protein
VKYAEYHQLLENKVNEEKEIKERLISEIKGSYRAESSDHDQYETEFLK